MATFIKRSSMLAVAHGVVAIAVCLDQVCLYCFGLISLSELLLILRFGALSSTCIGFFDLFSMRISTLALLFNSFGRIEGICLFLLGLFCLSLQFLLF